MTLIKTDKVTQVIFALDTSGSMDVIRDETIGMFNSQIETLQKEGDNMGKILVSLVLFGLHANPPVQTLLDGVDINEIDKMTRDDYLPQGMTPMRDGIGRAVTLGEENDSGSKDDAVLLIVLTDGQENDSREWTAEALAKKIAELRATDRWTVQVMGANIDLSAVEHFGIQTGEFSRYNGNADSMNAKSMAVNCYLSNYAGIRGQGLTRSVETIEDVE